MRNSLEKIVIAISKSNIILKSVNFCKNTVDGIQ